MKTLYYINLLVFVIFLFEGNISGQVKNKTNDSKIKIVLIGNSTVEDLAGWGQSFSHRFTNEVSIINAAVGGRSSKSWYNEGRLSAVLAEKPDYIFIEFGHNDQKLEEELHTNSETSFRDYLKIYVDSARAIGATPIIISPVTRRIFDDNGKINSSLGSYATGAKAVATENGVAFIDLWNISINYHNSIGKDSSMMFNYKQGDLTHLSPAGAEAITELIVKELKQVDLVLVSYLKKEM